MNPSPLHLSVLLVSATGLAYQVVLMRVLAMAQWHHFAYLIISMAMLGFGASGTVLAMARPWIERRPHTVYACAAWALAVSLAACYAASQRIPFETFELVSQRGQIRHLFTLYLVLAVPFFLMATCIATAFFIAPRGIGSVYGANLMGSGLGALSVALLLYVFHPVTLIYGLTGAAALAFAIPLLNGRRGWTVCGAGIAGIALIAVSIGYVPVRVSQYKGVSYVLDFPDAEIVASAWSPNAVIQAVSSSMIRETPGQLAGYPMSELGRLPPQIGLFFDGNGPAPVHRFDGELERFAFLDYVTTGLAYRLVERPRVLVIGAGGGTQVLSALSHGAEHVTAVDVDPRVFNLVDGPLGDFSGRLYSQPKVTPVVADGRGYLASSDRRFDLIEIAMLDSFAASAAGVFALNESYLYTREALELYLDRLTPNGALVITRWLKTPARDALKMFATAVEACERHGIEHPADHLVMIRSMNDAMILVSRAPLRETQVRAIREFCESRGFDTDYFPGIEPHEVNRFTRLETPVYHDFAMAVLFGDRQAAYGDALFHLRPATDASPYFFQFFRWRTLPHMVQTMGTQWVPFVEWGYLTLIACLAQAMVAGAVLIVLPLLGRRARRMPAGKRGWTLLGFFCLGLAFMFVEIALMQRLMLFLAYPIYGIAVVLAGLLVFTGGGSYFAGRSTMDRGRNILWAAAFIAVYVLAYMVVLEPVLHMFMGSPDAAKIPMVLALLAPLGFAMGIPFPMGLQTLSDRAVPLMPWAWGINGCASVLGPPLATLLAIHTGLHALMLAGIVLYIVSGYSLTRLQSE